MMLNELSYGSDSLRVFLITVLQMLLPMASHPDAHTTTVALSGTGGQSAQTPAACRDFGLQLLEPFRWPTKDQGGEKVVEL
jgi:hypothetical protein